MGRIIKRYGNRKLYDTRESRYITLDEIAGYVREGEDVTVIENGTGADLTSVAFAQIILEEERRRGGFLSLSLLRRLIRQGEQAFEGIASHVDRGIGAISGLGDLATQRVREFVGVPERPGNGSAEPPEKPLE